MYSSAGRSRLLLRSRLGPFRSGLRFRRGLGVAAVMRRGLGALAAGAAGAAAALLARGRAADGVAVDPEKGKQGGEEGGEHDGDDDADANVCVLEGVVGELAALEEPPPVAAAAAAVHDAGQHHLGLAAAPCRSAGGRGSEAVHLAHAARDIHATPAYTGPLRCRGTDACVVGG